METKCPYCGIPMRLELSKTLVAHPSEVSCKMSGMAFKVHKTDDAEPTWDEVCAGATKNGVPAERREAPAQTAQPVRDFAQTGPVPQAAPLPPAAPPVPGVPAPPAVKPE